MYSQALPKNLKNKHQLFVVHNFEWRIGEVYIESVHLYNAYGDDERIYDIAPNLITSTTTFSLSLTTVKLLFETPQQGSIKITMAVP